MNIIDLQDAYRNKLEKAKMFLVLATDFVDTVSIKVVEKIPKVLGINPDFVPLNMGVSVPYNDGEQIVSCIKIGTAIKFLLDKKLTPKIQEYFRVLVENGYASLNDNCYASFTEPRVIAFCMGMDNLSPMHKEPEKNLEESRKQCPEYPEAYLAGRQAGYQHHHMDFFPYNGSHLFIRMTILCDREMKERQTTDIEVKLSESPHVEPHIKEPHGWSYAFAKCACRPAATEKDIAEYILDTIDLRPRQEKTNPMRM